VFYMAWEIANREQRLVVDSNKPYKWRCHFKSTNSKAQSTKLE
jgi:hypothetical protein